MKSVLITGITGQDGSYMAEFLLSKGYSVTGIIRDGEKLGNINHLKNMLELIVGDVTDKNFVFEVIENIKPTEIYNFAAISNINNPWQDFSFIVQLNGLVPVQFLEAILVHSPKTKFFQASSSQMFGRKLSGPQTENTSFEPANIYAESKLMAHNIIGKLRSQKNIFAVSGILFNHESERRGSEFITRKIVNEFVKIKRGEQEFFLAGYLDALRDWGYAPEFIEGMWLTLQRDIPEDYIFATGISHSIRDFIVETAKCLEIDITWEGVGVEEVGRDAGGKVVVKINKEFYRSDESRVFGDISRIKKDLNWVPKVHLKQIIDLMVKSEYNR